jgi:hypothetical protein
MAGEERRRHPRSKAPGELLVAWQTGTTQAVSRLDTIAVGGMFIRTKAPAANKSMVQVLVEAPTGDVRARAIVRWADPKKGMGVEFVAMTQEDRGRLLQYLRRLQTAL